MSNLAIIFHSGAYDRVNHGLSLALVSLTMGGRVKLFFTHLSLKYVVEKDASDPAFSEDDRYYKTRYNIFLKEGHIRSIRELLKECKKLGGEIFVCPTSMALLNVTREELIPEVDGTAGIARFLSETADFRILFI